MSPTDQLRNEHSAIRAMLGVLGRVCTRLEADEKVNPDHLTQILEFMRLFADRYHHGKEEAFLFPALEETGLSRQGGPLGVMLQEHDEGREYVRRIGEAVSRYTEGATASAAEIALNARRFIGLLDGHIEKENTVLFPMADDRLGEEKQKELTAGFARAEEETIGRQKQEELLEVLHNLEGIYTS